MRRLFPFLLILGTVSPAFAEGPLFLKGPYVQRVGPTTAEIRVEVAPPAAISVELSGADGGRTSLRSPPKSFHTVALTGLSPDTAVDYVVRAGASFRSASFTTAPKEESRVPFRFLIYGDNRSDHEAHAAVVGAMRDQPGSFLINTGDFVLDGGDESQWQRFFDIETPLLSKRPLFSCVGNHELTDQSGAAYIRYFAPTAALTDSKPELSGSFRWGMARFFLVNAMASYAGGSDRDWLDKELSTSDNEAGILWRVVVMHHGLWSSGPHGGNGRMLTAGVLDVLKKHHVDLMLAGHDHIYERGQNDGIGYLISGGGGAPVYEMKNLAPGSKKRESVRHFVQAEISPEKMTMTAIRATGSTIETCAWVKNKGWDCDREEPKQNVSPAKTPDVTVEKKSGCGCETPGVAPVSPRFASILAIFALGGAARFRRRVRRWNFS